MCLLCSQCHTGDRACKQDLGQDTCTLCLSPSGWRSRTVGTAVERWRGPGLQWACLLAEDNQGKLYHRYSVSSAARWAVARSLGNL